MKFKLNCENKSLIPPSGLVIQATDAKKTEFKKTVDYPMAKGIHIWEIITILDCKDIQIGIISDSPEQTKQSKIYVQDFIASTQRTITVQLNLNTYQIDYYLNGNHNEKKTIKNLEKDKVYFPLIVFKSQAKIIALNPFTQHPQLQYPRIIPMPLGIFIEKPININIDQFPQLQIQNIQNLDNNNDYILKIKTQSNENQIYFHNDRIKLIRSGQFNKLNIFKINTQQSSEIQLQLSQFNILQQNWRWENSLKNEHLSQEQINQFIKSQCRNYKGTILIEAPFMLLKQIVIAQLLAYEHDFELIFDNINNQKVEIFKIIQIISTLLYLDEQLQTDEQELIEILSKTHFNKIAKIYSQYDRLFTFLDSTQPQNIIILVKNGLLRLPGFANQLRHFSNYRLPLEPLIMDNIKQILPKEKIFNFLDVPLEVNINSQPPKQFQGKLVQRSPSSIYFSTLDEQGQLTVWNGEFQLTKMITFDFREQKQLEKENALIASLFDEDLEGNSDLSPQIELVIEPNEDILNQMYTMGFSLEVAKKALIEVKNASIDLAIEKAWQLQDLKIEKPPIQKDAVKQLKLQWVCEACTFLNTNENLTCGICEQPPQESDFVKEETQIDPQQQEQQQQIQIQPEVIPPQSQENYYKDAQITHVNQIDINDELIFVCAFKLDNHHSLMIKRLRMAHSNIFLRQSEGGQWISYLNNQQGNDQKKLMSYDENCRFIWSSLFPSLNREYENKYWEIYDQTTIDVNEEILNSVLINQHQICVFGVNNILTFNLVENQDKNIDKFTLNQVDSIPHALKQVQYVIQHNLVIYVADQNILFSLKGSELIELQHFKQQIVRLTIDCEDLIIHHNGNEQSILILVEQQQLQQQQQQQQPHQIQTSNIQQQFDLIKFTSEEIGNLEKLNESQPVYFHTEYQGQRVLMHQSANNQYYQSIIIQPFKSIKLTLDKPSKILNLKLSAYVDETIECEMITIQQETLSVEGQQQIPTKLFSHKGSQFNVQQCMSKTCFIQQEPSSTIYPHPGFMYKNLQDKYMNITSYQVSSPTKPVSTGLSLQSGLVFVGDFLSEFSESYRFSNFNGALYAQWKEERAKNPHPYQSWEPISYFDLGQQETITVALETPRIAKYVMMMSLSARGTDQNIFNQNPLAFYYFIVRGSILKEMENPTGILLKENDLFKELDVKLDGSSIKNMNRQMKQELFRNSNIYHCNIEVSQIQKEVYEIEIDIIDQRIKYLQIQATKQKEIPENILQKMPNAHQISDLMYDNNQYGLFNFQLMKMIHDENAQLQQRIACIKLLCTIFRNNAQQITLCYKDLDCLKYLKLNLLTQDTKEENSVQRFLFYFSQIEGFQKSFQNALMHILNHLFQDQGQIRPSGFIQLLFQIKQITQQNPSELYPYLLNHLKQILKFINKLDSKQYLSKLNQLGIYGPIFDSQLFSDKYVSQKPNSTQIQEIIEQVSENSGLINHNKTIHSIINYQVKGFCEIYNIDFLTKYNVRKFKLIFNQAMQLQCRIIRIQLYHDQQLLLDVNYNDSMTLQLTKYAQLHKQEYTKSKLNVMQFNLDLKAIQYLKIQISYSQSIMMRLKDEQNVAPKELCLIPQFKGSLIKNNVIISSKNKPILANSGELQFDNSLKYQKYIVNDLIHLDSTGTINSENEVQIQEISRQEYQLQPEKTQKLKELLLKAQNELKDQLDKGNEQVEDKVQLISKLQLEILNLEKLPTQNISSSFDFLTTYTKELIDILISIDQGNKSWRESSTFVDQEGLKMAQLLYTSFKDNLSDLGLQAIKLLNILLSNLNLKNWIIFTFKQYESLQNNLNIENLKRIKIPISQTIVYILNSKYKTQLLNLVIHKLQSKTINEKEFQKFELQSLKPIGTTRSTSSQEIEEPDLSTYQEMNMGRVLESLFQLMNYALVNEIQIFSITCDLFLMLKIERMQDFVADICNEGNPLQSRIINLISNAVVHNDQGILRKLKEFIEKLVNSPDCSKLIFYILQNLLGAVVELANKENQINLKLTTQMWFNYISFLISQLLQLQNIFKNTQLQRKKSLPLKQQQLQQNSNTFQDFLERIEEGGMIQICTIDTILQMLQFLEQSPKNLQNVHSLNTSLTYWGLLMNLLCKMKTQQLIEYKIFNQIIVIYIRLESSLQVILQSRFLEMIKQILEQNQNNEINSYLVGIVLEHQNQTIMSDILSILSQRERKLNQKTFQKLFVTIAKYLLIYCNIGRADGIHNCQLTLLKQLQFGNKLLQLMIQGDYSIKVQAMIVEIPNYGSIIYEYIHWYSLNKYTVNPLSPATDILLQLSRNVKLLFDQFNEIPLQMEALKQMYKFQKELDLTISNLQSLMPSNITFNLIKYSQEIFEELNEQWMTNDQVVREVAITANGFEYLLEKTHLTKSLSSQTDAIESINEEEYGNKLTLFEANGTKSAFQAKDWQVHKKGVKTRIYSVTLKDEQFDEYAMDFQLEKSIELKSIRIGFQVYTPEFADKILGLPQNVIVEVRQKDSVWYPLGVMNLIEDEAYTYYSVKVMALNVNRINSQSTSLDDQLRSICQEPISWIRFVLKRPQITFMETISQLQLKQYNQIQIGVSFISVTGFEVGQRTSTLNYLQEQTASRLLGKMCSQKFRNTLSDISQNQSIIGQIKKSFENISKALTTNESTLSPLFIGLTKYNPEFGDWVLDQLLDLNKECVHAKLTAEIILQDSQKQTARLIKFLEFVLKSIGDSSQQLPLFIESLTYTIRISAKQLKQPTTLPIQEKDLYNILSQIQLVSETQQANILIKLLITLIDIPKPYNYKDQCINKFTDHLFNLYTQDHIYTLRILGALILSQIDVAHFMQTKIDIIIKDALNALEQVDNILLNDYFFFLDSAANLEMMQDQFRKYHIQIYEKLKQSNPNKSLLKPIEYSTIQYIVSFIGKTVLSKKECIIELAHKLIEDIKLLSQIVDINYVENILMPLLNFEAKINFTLDVWDKDAQIYVGDIRKLSTKLQAEQDEDFNNQLSSLNELNGFSSKDFTPIYQDALLSAIQKVVKSNNFKKGGKWIKEIELTNGGGYFAKALSTLQKGPFLVILFGKNGNSGDNCIVGLFSTQKCGNLITEFSHDYYPGEVYPIAENGEQFVFTYEKSHIYHLLNNDRKAFGVGMEHENGGSFSFMLERVNLTFSDEQQDISSVSIGIHDFELLEQRPEEDYYFDDFWMQKMEIWTYQQEKTISKGNRTQMFQLNHKEQQNVSLSTFGYGILAQSILQDKYLNKSSALNYLSPTPVYNLPQSATQKNILQSIKVSSLSLNDEAISNNKIDLNLKQSLAEYKSQQQQQQQFVELKIDGIELLSQLNSQNEQSLQYHANLPIFDQFQQQDGVKQIILAVHYATTTWANAELTKIWGQYVSELSAFSSIPQFFSYYLQNKQSMELLFQLLAGIPDSGDPQIWKDKEIEAVKFIYDTLSNVFKTYNNSEIRIIAINDNLIQTILDRISIVSKEQKRSYQEIIIAMEEVEEQAKVELPNKEERKNIKKQGVGYGSDQTGQNQKWNTQEYIDKKKVRSEQLKSLLEIIKNFFNYENWHLTLDLAQKINIMIFESALLPLLEAAFRSGSLLEMSKDHELTLCYLSLTKTLAKHKNLAPLLMRIPENYVPRQIDSLEKLLSNLSKIAQIFLSCIIGGEQNAETNLMSKQIATVIVETDQAVQEAISKFEHNLSDSDDPNEEIIHDHQLQEESLLQEILKKPLAESYRLLLKDLRFDYISFKNTSNQYQHFYERQIASAAAPTSVKLIRLAQEFADMSNSLPVEHTNAIFVRADKERVDVIKALIMGATGTPYAHGAYLFDIYFDESYPNSPPKMNLSTTGTGKIRFNPNLYACGKVCLSLLGTWRGHASENWDPKLSTLLQVLVSTQAIIMSEDVYFNEPGFEGEASTAEGEAKNEAYSNIVKYGNIQFAILEQIKNPSTGFEDIIRRHFYLKKDEILEEIQKWVEQASQKSASYNGLVQDHNSQWCTQFKKSKTSFYDAMKQGLIDLENALKGIAPPKLIGMKRIEQKQKRKQIQRNKDQGQMNIDEVDMSYDQNQKELVMDILDEKVRDRWSRYIGAMGMDAVKKQSNAKVFLSGVDGLGIEIAKNIILSGVQKLVIHDQKIVNRDDLIGQFFLNEEDIGKCRSQGCVNKLQQLNNYVRVSVIEQQVQQYIVQERFDIVILTDVYLYDELICWSNLCREHKIKLIVSSVEGVYARILVDLGEEHVVLDKNGEEIPDVIIKSIDSEGKVLLLEGQKAQFEDGDKIMIYNVEGMINQEGKSINNSIHIVKTINQSSFQIEKNEIEGYSPYIRNGIAKLVKQSIVIKNQPLIEVLNNGKLMDNNLLISDFIKLDEPYFLQLAYKTLARIMNYQTLPNLTQILLNKIKEFDEFNLTTEKTKYLEYYLTIFSHVITTQQFPPLCAYIGGIVTQEIIKALTNKFTPINQSYYTDCIEVLPYPLYDSKKQQQDPIDDIILQQSNLTNPIDKLLGTDLTQKIQKANLFMVGCGAIGCELLKNFAMLNVALQGQITITDPDHIETSNLSRQFLFREKHIHKPKSQTAAAAVQQMNPQLKGHIVARMEKVFEGTEHIFSDNFFEQQTIIANALDNVQARRYVDRRCVKAQRALLESGTLGPKGHVQCIIPHKTESYGSQNDPVEEGDIPYCTLKMFPEETFHCVEFARDKFGKLFTLKPKSVLKVLDDHSAEDLKQIRATVKLLKQVPQNFDDCLQWARNKYQKYFVNDIKQLLFTYPPDTKTKDGQPFWRLPKRPPRVLEYNPQEQMQVYFVSTMAFLRAQMFGIEQKDWRNEQNRQKMAEFAMQFQTKEWIPNNEKKKEIEEQVLKLETKLQQEEVVDSQDEREQLLGELQNIKQKLKIKLFPQEFEKDQDNNGHIDFIHAFGNLRASNYQLEPMDWITVKLKAGRIVPALATTTAVVAGLQTIEFVKILKGCSLDTMKNGFINLAIPIVQLTEPGACPKIKLNEQVEVTLWDRWEVRNQQKLGQLFEYLRTTYFMEPINVFYKSASIYCEDLVSKNQTEKEKQLNTSLIDLFEEEIYVDLIINFTINNVIVQGVPEVRLFLK